VHGGCSSECEHSKQGALRSLIKGDGFSPLAIVMDILKKIFDLTPSLLLSSLELSDTQVYEP